MEQTIPDIRELIRIRDSWLETQREIYISTVENINLRYRELLKDDFGSKLANNCARDFAGEIVRRFFDTGDYYITVDQMYDRIVHFTYDTPETTSDIEIRKMLYNNTDSPEYSQRLKDVSQSCREAQKKLFEKELTDSGKKVYIDKDIIETGKIVYRKKEIVYDEITGKSGEHLEVDHIQAAATATINSRYLNTDAATQKMKEFFKKKHHTKVLKSMFLKKIQKLGKSAKLDYCLFILYFR